jgi:hypothetical protein
MFLKFFDICYNKHGRWAQKFASRVTKFWPCDEIRRFDGKNEVQVTKKHARIDLDPVILPSFFGKTFIDCFMELHYSINNWLH